MLGLPFFFQVGYLSIAWASLELEILSFQHLISQSDGTTGVHHLAPSKKQLLL